MDEEQLKAAQDSMLAAATSVGEASLLTKFNNWLWPTCSVCAGWRGFVLGVICTHTYAFLIFQVLTQ